VGRSGTGKTTLLEQAVRLLCRDGARVLAVKSSHHEVPDREGSDSRRLARAGAQGVALLHAGGAQLSLQPPLSLEELLPLLAARFDAVLIEGGKRSSLPKVELLFDRRALLAEEEVVAYLRRDEGDGTAAQRLLELLEAKGQMVQATKA
jgi:molybdopterin-guanine dinucleotide biosynthesis protein MobB